MRTSRDVCYNRFVLTLGTICCRLQLDAHPPVRKATGLYVRFPPSAVSHIMPPFVKRKNCNEGSWTMSFVRGSYSSHSPTLADEPSWVITIVTTASPQNQRSSLEQGKKTNTAALGSSVGLAGTQKGCFRLSFWRWRISAPISVCNTLNTCWSAGCEFERNGKYKPVVPAVQLRTF